ncbi:MAG TPA: GyrI-like domain-containing protein [Pseudobacteroides sp.]|uniref:AraC family transcriptional regulator n=1 Tax=Pseudobacteroides sp. TaxID=1968840 RepID=UPI002F94158B
MDYRKELLREEYRSRINKVQDYIEANICEELSVVKLAEVANFSPYHFHRIFSAMTGESLYQHIQRIRLEKSASTLVANPKKSITEVAYECGFTNQASFARAFKKYFNVSAGEWRKNPRLYKSKNCKMDSNLGKENAKDFPYNKDAVKNFYWREKYMSNIRFSVEVKEMPELSVVYIRNTGSYKGDQTLFDRLFGKLYTWADARGLINFPETKMITVYHDNPEITEENNLRISACMTAPEDTQVDGEIGKMKISGGKYAIGHFEIKGDQYQDAWNTICGEWFPESGYQPDEGPCFELYLNDHNQHPEKMHIVDIYVPVKPL